MTYPFRIEKGGSLEFIEVEMIGEGGCFGFRTAPQVGLSDYTAGWPDLESIPGGFRASVRPAG